MKVENEVSVFRAKINGKIAFRGVGKMMGKPEDLVSIIEDPSGWKNWIRNLKSGKLQICTNFAGYFRQPGSLQKDPPPRGVVAFPINSPASASSATSESRRHGARLEAAVQKLLAADS